MAMSTYVGEKVGLIDRFVQSFGTVTITWHFQSTLDLPFKRTDRLTLTGLHSNAAFFARTTIIAALGGFQRKLALVPLVKQLPLLKRLFTIAEA